MCFNVWYFILITACFLGEVAGMGTDLRSTQFCLSKSFKPSKTSVRQAELGQTSRAILLGVFGFFFFFFFSSVLFSPVSPGSYWNYCVVVLSLSRFRIMPSGEVGLNRWPLFSKRIWWSPHGALSERLRFGSDKVNMMSGKKREDSPNGHF